jgi:hypothetical protein
MTTKKMHAIFYGVIVAVWGLYLYVTLSAPQSSNQFNLSRLQIVLLQLTITVPYLVAWLAAARGALLLRGHAKKLADGVMRQGFSFVATGLWWLFASLFLPTLISALRTALRAYPTLSAELTAPLIIASNYVNIVLPLIGFWFLYHGARRIATPAPSASKQTSWDKSNPIIVGVFLAIVAPLYVYLVFTNPVRTVSTDPAIVATYHLPDILIVLTIVIPALVSWGLGMSASLALSGFIPQGSQLLKRYALQTFTRGVWLIIAASMLLQMLVSVGSQRFAGIGLGSILLILYVFIGLQVLGYILTTIGVQGLSSDADQRTTAL